MLIMQGCIEHRLVFSSGWRFYAVFDVSPEEKLNTNDDGMSGTDPDNSRIIHELILSIESQNNNRDRTHARAFQKWVCFKINLNEI